MRWRRCCAKREQELDTALARSSNSCVSPRPGPARREFGAAAARQVGDDDRARANRRPQFRDRDDCAANAAEMKRWREQARYGKSALAWLLA